MLGRANGLHNLCHLSGTVRDVGFSALGVVPAAGYETSFWPYGENFSQISPGSLSLERPKSVHRCRPLRFSGYEENSDNKCFVDEGGGI